VAEFSWDAQQLYKWDGTTFERFIDEPWTADAWWQFQASRPYYTIIVNLNQHLDDRTVFLRMRSHFALSCMQIRQGSRHLVPRKGIPSLPGVQIYRY